MSSEIERFAFELTDAAESREQWRTVVRFGMESLLRSPATLIEIIARRAEKEARLNESPDTDVFSDYVVILFKELNLKFVRANSPGAVDA